MLWLECSTPALVHDSSPISCLCDLPCRLCLKASSAPPTADLGHPADIKVSFRTQLPASRTPHPPESGAPSSLGFADLPVFPSCYVIMHYDFIGCSLDQKLLEARDGVSPSLYNLYLKHSLAHRTCLEMVS